MEECFEFIVKTEDTLQTFRIKQFIHTKLLTCSAECQLQVLQWLSPVHLVVVKNVRSVVMEDSTERSAITPA